VLIDVSLDADASTAPDASDAADASGAADAPDAHDVHDADSGDAGGLPLPLSTYTFTASTVCADHTIDVPCDSSHGGADVFYSFTLSLTEIVYADTFPAIGVSPSFTSILFFTDSIGAVLNPTDGRACDVSASCPASHGSQIVMVLTPGTYYLGVSSVGTRTGTVDVHMRFLPVDRGAVHPLATGMQTITGNISAMGGGLFPVCNSPAHGAVDTYWWAACADATATTVTANVCSTSLFYFAGAVLRSADLGDSCPGLNGMCPFAGLSLTANVSAGAGLYALYVGGSNCNIGGSYTLSVNRP
jgi:hypothetical protein